MENSKKQKFVDRKYHLLFLVIGMILLLITFICSKQLDEKELNGKIIFDWAKNGDEDAKFAINTLMENLADGITNITAVLNPEMIILGGGIMAQSEYLRPLINNALKQRLVEDVYTHTKVDFAKLENDAGMLGALYNLLHQTM